MKKKDSGRLNLWQNREGMPHVQIINSSDFDIDSSLRKLDLSSKRADGELGICDPAEIRERNNLMRLLFSNPQLRTDILEIYQTSSRLSIPTDENSFLFFYQRELNPYWEKVKGLISRLKAQEGANPLVFPNRMSQFITKLEEALPLETDEKKLAVEVSARLDNVAVMEGIFDVAVNIEKGVAVINEEDIVWTHIHGYKLFNSSYAAEYEADIPDWLDEKFWKKIGLTSLVQGIANYLTSKKAKRSAVINKFSSNLIADLVKGFTDGVLKKFDVKKSGFEWEESLIFTVYFDYSKDGLNIMPVSVEKGGGCSFWWQHGGLPVSSSKQQAAIEKGEKKIQKLLYESLIRTNLAYIFNCFPENFFGSRFQIPSPGTDKDYRWFAIGHVYNHKLFRKTYQKISSQRHYFFDVISQLTELVNILSRFKNQARHMGAEICIPEISFKEHSGVYFEKLAPISLINKATTIVPISLERINGQMVGLTGRHGGGKTEAGKSILQSVYFALSGLPVFAHSFKTDIKTVLGAVTNDGGDGSTATVFVTKVKNLMEEISKVPVHESLIFIDEIGKGTQQEAGFALGKKILAALRSGGNSVLFNTQILELAQFAQDNLDAACYKVDKDHKFTKGIAGGEIDNLVKEVGLDKYLN